MKNYWVCKHLKMSSLRMKLVNPVSIYFEIMLGIAGTVF